MNICCDLNTPIGPRRWSHLRLIQDVKLHLGCYNWHCHDSHCLAVCPKEKSTDNSVGRKTLSDLTIFNPLHQNEFFFKRIKALSLEIQRLLQEKSRFILNTRSQRNGRMRKYSAMDKLSSPPFLGGLSHDSHILMFFRTARGAQKKMLILQWRTP